MTCINCTTTPFAVNECSVPEPCKTSRKCGLDLAYGAAIGVLPGLTGKASRKADMLAILFGAVSLLYATVGQAGGTAFLAVMAMASFPSNEMRPTALLLNIIAATYSTWVFNRGRLVDWLVLRPLLLASLPTALVGGFIVLNERIYNVVTGVVLLSAAGLLIFRRVRHQAPTKSAPLPWAIIVGAAVGFVSGLTGVGGGVFLAPILIGLHWASPKQTAAISAPFILGNSAVGLAGTWYAGQVPSRETWLYAVACLLGAIAGAAIGLRWLSQSTTRCVLAVILVTAGFQLLFF